MAKQTEPNQSAEQAAKDQATRTEKANEQMAGLQVKAAEALEQNAQDASDTRLIDQVTPGAETVFEKAPPVAGADQVQAKFDDAKAKGYLGKKTDSLPNSAYTAGQGGDVQPAKIKETPRLFRDEKE